MPDRQVCASVTRQHGAWLVSLDYPPMADDLGAVDLYSAAASLATAKRVAVQGARDYGYSGAVRWALSEHGWWELTMTLPEEEGEVAY